MTLDPAIVAQVAHLFDATLAQVLSGAVAGPPTAGPMTRDDVVATESTIPGPAGPVRIRRYRPRDAGERAPLPALVWAHGGGWRFGDLDMPEADSVAQAVAASLPGEVVSVEYRLAPAHHHPAALDDVVAVLAWAMRDGAAHGIDPARVALGGASAGGTLAAAAAIVARDAGQQLPAALFLAYPVTDPLGGPYEPRRHPDCPPLLWLDREAMTAMFELYVGGDPAGIGAPIVPAAADLAGLPPMLVATAEVDALAAQAQRFVASAGDAGVAVTHHAVEGVLHGYLNTVGDSPAADRALSHHVEWLREVLGA